MMRSWRYKLVGGEMESRIFEGDALAAAERDGWHDSPKTAVAAGAVQNPTRQDGAIDDALGREELLSLADELKISVDRRWGVIRLREAIEEATKG